MNTVLTLFLIALLSGCAEFRAMETGIAQHGAEAADTALRDSLWAACQAATIGAVRRWVGPNTERAAAYDRICSERPTILPVQATQAHEVSK